MSKPASCSPLPIRTGQAAPPLLARLSLDTAYAFAKKRADNQGTYGAASGTQSFVDEQGGYDATYAYNQHLDYGQVTGTRRHRSVSSGVYELPVGRGKHIFGNMSRTADLALGGWQLSGIFALQTRPALRRALSLWSPP